jgi:hypothetical protein
MWLIVGVFAAMLIYTWFGPRVRRLSIEINAITVCFIIYATAARLTCTISYWFLLRAEQRGYLAKIIRGQKRQGYQSLVSSISDFSNHHVREPDLVGHDIKGPVTQHHGKR